MKLLRWSLAGATAYVIYKYAIGKKADAGEAVFTSPETDPETVTPVGGSPMPASGAKPKRAAPRTKKRG